MAETQLSDRQRLGGAIQRRRRELGLTQAQLAERLGVHKQTVVKYERGEVDMGMGRLHTVAEHLDTSALDLLAGAGIALPVRVGYDSFVHLKAGRALPEAAREVVAGYLHRMSGAGCSTEQIDEAERLMVESSYSKLHAPDPRPRSEADMIMDIDAAWDFIRDVLRRQGVRV